MGVACCGQKWTEEEKQNAEHFLKSLSLAIEAHSTSNRGGPGLMSRQDLKKFPLYTSKP
jgi:hypothetical protein